MTYTYDRRAVRQAIRAAGGPGPLAEKAGIGRQALSYWMRGLVIPRADNLAKLASALGTSPAAFFSGRS